MLEKGRVGRTVDMRACRCLMRAAPLMAVMSAERVRCDSGKRGNRALHENFLADAAEKASPAVVSVVIRKSWSLAAGSGFIISKDGFVVTNAHVVSGATNHPVDIVLWDGTRKQGRIHSLDVLSDIALIKIDARDGLSGDLPVAKIGRSATLRAGEFVIALGSPLTLKGSVTFGIVSATARRALEMGVRPSSEQRFMNTKSEYIQTDAAINQGNSGGPLCNLDGEVIGINNMKASVEGIGFAIPIDKAMVVIEQLKLSGVVVRPYVGMSMEVSRLSGKVEVTDVVRGSPAQLAGLARGDQLLEANGKAVRGIADVYDAIGSEVGAELELLVRRGADQGVRRVVTVADRPRGA